MKYFLQFGGQGTPWLREFIRYQEDPKMNKFYALIFKAIEENAPKLNQEISFPQGFDIQKWFTDHRKAPENIYLSRSAISFPMIQACQLAHLEYLHCNGFTREKLLKNSVALTGHSQGLITATFLSLCLEGEEYYNSLYDYTRYIFYMGARAQEFFTDIFPTEEEVNASRKIGSEDPDPMAAILGKDHLEIKSLIDDVNQGLEQEEKIYISLYNTADNRVISSKRSSMILLDEKIKKLENRNRPKYLYIKSSCPFHSPLLKKMKETFENDLKNISFDYKGSDLHIPVYSFSDGRNMQNDHDLGTSLFKEIILNTLYWEKPLASILKNHSIREAIDFGPGRVSQRLSDSIFKSRNEEVSILCASSSKDQEYLILNLK